MSSFLFITNWVQGKGQSGGDTIWVELARNWGNYSNVSIIGSPEGKALAQRCSLNSVPYFISVSEITSNNNLGVFMLIKNTTKRLFEGIKYFFTLSQTEETKYDYVYSTSDFLPDAIPAFVYKLRNKGTKWISGFYLFAPFPFSKNSPYKGVHRIKNIFYWISQVPSFAVTKLFADYVFVTSEPDVQRFVTSKRSIDKIIVVQGGVDVTPMREYLRTNKYTPANERVYSGAFLGRLHPQKGVLELIDIWAKVCEVKPQAKLALMGDGELADEVKSKISRLNMESNIEMLGFTTGEKKFQIYRNSRIFLHPATYDSGGMACAEAMAWGLPGVSFDLEALKTYYPKGLLKTPVGDLDSFSSNVVKLLEDTSLYTELSAQAQALIFEVWDWEKRADLIYKKVVQNDTN